MPFFSRSSSSNPARRRDDGDELRALSFDAESFEFVPAGEAVGLLRLSGRWIAAVDRRRHESLEEEIRSHAVLENDLRSARAMQEAELAAAATHASQRAKRAERQRDRATSVEAGERQRRPVDADLVERLQRARRAA